MIMYQIDIFCTSAFFALPPVGRFRALGCGARRKLARTLRCKCGPWPRSVARALGVQSRDENWQVTTRSVSHHPEPTRPMETPTKFWKFEHPHFPPDLMSAFHCKPPPPSPPAREATTTITASKRVSLGLLLLPFPPSSK